MTVVTVIVIAMEYFGAEICKMKAPAQIMNPEHFHRSEALYRYDATFDVIDDLLTFQSKKGGDRECLGCTS